jgi:predicted MPP superfamily phosphohydrolase
VIRLLVLAFSLAMNAPIIGMLFSGHPPLFQSSPTWYAAAVTLWQLGLVACMPIFALLRLIALGLRWAFRRLVPRRARVEPETFDPSRRAALKTALATGPVALLAGLTVISRAQEGRLLIHRHDLPAPWLPERLRGLTITHITDLHVGRLFRPHMLPGLIDQVNALKGDIVVVTGDIVDNSNLLLPEALDALAHITHRHGMFLCIGNHDEIDDRTDFIRTVRQRNFALLINQRRRVEIGGERITIAGLDFAGSGEPTGRRRMGNIANVEEALDGYRRQTDGPIIAIAHHPHTWDVLARVGVPLTLSGHTHGGQLMLTPPDERPDIGVGRILFRYTRGFYHNGPSTLFVNSGVGNWFPLRIHAPAEIVQIRLT